MITMQERHNSSIATSKSMIAMERSDLSDDNLTQLALFILNYLNGLHLTGMVYAFTKEDMNKQFKLLRALIFRTEIDLGRED